MTKEEIIEELENLRFDLNNELTEINAKHELIRQQLCNINSILSRAKENDNAGLTE